jgi:nitrite reductase/ring-hydroxylating ferredoxin subunit
MTRVDLGGIPVVVLRTEAGIHAIGAACTHRGAPLDEGTLEDACVRCPWHGSLFAFDDGRVLEGPASFPQPRFDARVRGGKIELRAIRET